jgi:hypothetical protein
MKKTFLSSALMLACGVVLAQPTISADQFNYVSAPSFSYKYMSGSTAIPPGAAGANANWNFSTLSAGSTLNYTTASCPGDVDCGTFPGANQVVGVSSLAKVYFNKTSSLMEQVGEKGSANIIFSNPMKMLQFPMSFGQTFSDSYESSNPQGSKNGTVTSTIDAYGTLKTPTGTYTNVLRQKIVDVGTIQVGPSSYTMTATQYYWMKPGTHHYIMAIISTEMTGLPVPVPASYVATYTTAAPGNTGIEVDQDILAEKIAVYPNPATNEFTVEANGLNIANIDLYNVVGQKVLSKTGAVGTLKMTVNELTLNAGCYFLKINTNQGQITKQVIIR